MFEKHLVKPFRKLREQRFFRQSSRKDVFSYIYRTNKWGCDESRSGKGSDLAITQTLREALPAALEDLGVSSIVDLPCGDMNWITQIDLSQYRYVGADIVAELIEANRRAYPDLEFIRLDICEEKIPQADLVLCRDLFVHLSFSDIEVAMNNVFSSPLRYLACTTFPKIEENQDKLTGNHRKLNMAIEPFRLGEPMLMIDDDPRIDKFLGVWKVEGEEARGYPTPSA